MRILLAVILLISLPVKADTLYEQCMQESEDTASLGACGSEYLERLTDQLEQVWQSLLIHYNENDPAAIESYERIILSHLHDEQEKWEAYKNSACQVYGAVEETENGSSIRIFGSGGTSYTRPQCLSRVIKQRIEILRGHLCEFDC